MQDVGRRSMTVVFDLVEDDLRAYVRHAFYDVKRSRRSLMLWRGACLVAFSIPFVAGVGSDVPGRTIPVAVSVWAVLVLPGAWFLPELMRSYAARLSERRELADTRSLGRWVVVATADGLEYRHQHGSGIVPWCAVSRIDAAEAGLYVYTTPINAYVIPSSAFQGHVEKERFEELCERYMGHAHGDELRGPVGR